MANIQMPPDPGFLQSLAMALAGQNDQTSASDVPQDAPQVNHPLSKGLMRPFLPQSLSGQMAPDFPAVPVPQTGPYGAPSVTRDGPQSMALPPPSQDQFASSDNRGAPPSQSAPVGPSDAPEEDATTAAYRSMHEKALTTYNQAIAMARSTAGTPASAAYLSIAQEAVKEANAINMKAIDYAKPLQSVQEDQWVLNHKTGQYEQPVKGSPNINVLGNDQLTQAERDAGGEWTIDTKTGKREQIGATAGEKKQLRVIAKDPITGAETMGIFDPGTGDIKPYKAPAAPADQTSLSAGVQQLEIPNAGEGDKTPAIKLPPDQMARLEQVNPAFKGTVESILQGKLGLPKITAGRGAALPLAITEAVKTVNPNFDANTNQTQLAARKAFNAGGSNNTPGQLILNSDAALAHFEPLVRASDALPAYGSGLGGLVLGAERMTGGHFGGDYQNKVSALESAATPASAETMKYLAGTTGGGEGERLQLIHSFSDSGGTPQSRRESVSNYIEDMLAKKAEIQNQWHTAMDTPNGMKAPDFPVISDSARQAVIRMGYGDMLKKYGLEGTNSAPATGQQAPASKKGVYVPGQGIQWQ